MVASAELATAGFLAIMLVASFLSHKTRFPYTLVLVLVGIVLTSTSIASLFGPFQTQIQGVVASIRSIYDQLTAGTEGGLFVALIIPPLLFESMMNVSSVDLKRVIRPSFVLATVGVVISTVVVGLLLWLVAGLSFYVSFLFAALISPTDAATVLALFRKAHVPSKLAALMDTEAALNDATAIVIFSILLASINLPRIPIFSALLSFATTFGGGALIGAGVAFLAEILTSTIQDRLAETVLTIFAVYGSYSLASAFGFSGLVAVAIVGIYFGNLTVKTAMGPATREAVRLFWEIAAFVGNSVAFLFIGFQTDLLRLIGSLGIIAVAYSAVLLARGASVYPLLSFFNRRSANVPRTWKNVAMLGGMRGALSVALVASIPVSAFVSSSDLETITTMVLGVAFASISIQAAILSRYIRRNFPMERIDQLNVRMSRAVAAIENLERMKEEGKLTAETFMEELEKDREELRETLGEIHEAVSAKNILRSRASELYSSIVSLPMSRAMHVLRSHKMEEPIESMVERTKTEEDSKKTEERPREETPQPVP